MCCQRQPISFLPWLPQNHHVPSRIPQCWQVVDCRMKTNNIKMHVPGYPSTTTLHCTLWWIFSSYSALQITPLLPKPLSPLQSVYTLMCLVMKARFRERKDHRNGWQNRLIEKKGNCEAKLKAKLIHCSTIFPDPVVLFCSFQSASAS